MPRLVAQFLAWYPRTLMWKGRWGMVGGCWMSASCSQSWWSRRPGTEDRRPSASLSLSYPHPEQPSVSPAFPLGSGLVGVTDGVCLFIYTVPVQTHQLRCGSVGAPAPAWHLGRGCPRSSALARLWNTPDNPAVVPGTHEDKNKKKKQDHFCVSTGRVGDGKTK